MKRFTTFLGLVMVLGSACGEAAVVRTFDWSELVRSGALAVPGVSTGAVGGRSLLRVVNETDQPRLVRLLTLVDPGVTQRVYSVVGEIRYEGVVGDGFLEMWNCFPPAVPGGQEGRYFSRTLGDGGRMGKLSGRSEWRDFELMFDRTGASTPPHRLEINLHLPGRGVVDFGPVRLEGYVEAGARSAPIPPGRVEGAWWSSRTGGVIGGTLGAIWGVFMGMAGALAGRGKARTLVVRGFALIMVLGAVLTLAGIVAAAFRQPHSVWFALFLPGIIALGLVPGQLGAARRRYADLELRRMLAADAGESSAGRDSLA
ncbi:MAG: hypothetical protein IT580_09360 [Verrucomicrobiales bacterium]|nr:hypothetical protein [Verrucomicrobiales bacterium]